MPFLPTGEIKLDMPTINLNSDASVLATVPEVVEALESCAMTWQKLISAALEEQLKRVPQVMLPIAPSLFYSQRHFFIPTVISLNGLCSVLIKLCVSFLESPFTN